MAEQNRTPRDDTTRQAAPARPATAWAPASTLPIPRKDDGYQYRWIRRTFFGQDDPTNMSKKMREGWEPVNPADHPELAMFTDARDRKAAGLIEVGGLILARIPRETAKARQRYYQGLADQQIRSVDQQLANEQVDARMPIFQERRSKTSSFGRGD